MGEQFTGNVDILNASSEVIIYLKGEKGDIGAGGHGTDGDLILRDNENRNVIHLVARDGLIRVGGGSREGQSGPKGDICIRDGNGSTTIHLRGENPQIRVGGGGSHGIISVRDKEVGKETIRMDGGNAGFKLGGNGQDGDFYVTNSAGKTTLHLNGEGGDLRVGGEGVDGDVSVRNRTGQETIRLDGDSGDIILHNADCAEDFDIAELEEIEPGTVMVLDQDGKLQQSTEVYDKKVAGVISGASDCKPAIVLDKKSAQANRKPIALVGKVYCKVDAQFSPIEIGDLLTTSSTPGHAMKATDLLKAFGAVLGKALRPLQSGRDMIPILVALQ